MDLNLLTILSYFPHATAAIISIYTAKETIKSYNLHKEYKHKNIDTINLPPELTPKYSDINLEPAAHKQFYTYIDLFTKIITKNFSKEDLTLFYNNINELKIENKNFTLFNLLTGQRQSGRYYDIKNLIQVDFNNLQDYIFHEFFHMASTIFQNKIIYSGFEQRMLIQDKLTIIGEAINEGYTQLLTLRYFDTKYYQTTENESPTIFPTIKSNKDKDIYELKNIKNEGYSYQIYITAKLEKIIGQKKMENLYLTANLPGLITELTNYSTKEEIIKFISNTDFFHNNIYKENIKLSKHIFEEVLNNIGNFLAQCYQNKLNKQIKEGLITPADATLKFHPYINSLTENTIYFQNSPLNFITKEQRQNYLKNISPINIPQSNKNHHKK